MSNTNLSDNILSLLTFESKILNKDIYKFNVENPAQLIKLKEEIKFFSNCYIVTQVETVQNWLISDLLKLGFKVLGFPLLLENRLKSSENVLVSPNVRLSNMNDLEPLLKITKGSFTNVHWYKEQNVFAESKIDDIYLQWVRNSFSGRADSIFVFESGGVVQGFLSANYYPEANLAKIDLLCVSPDQRGKGIGKELVRAFLNHYSKTCDLFQVKTEADNFGAVRAYNNCGFYSKILSVNLNLLIS